MGYVALRERREDRDRSRKTPESSSQGFARNPYVLLGTGFVLGASAPGIFQYGFFPDGSALLVSAVLIVAVAVILYAGWLLVHKGPAQDGRGLGSEKQLLLAILDAGPITPVEAALETSLTADEAEEILTRLADRGHLVVEGRDGALFYALPGRRRTPDPRTV